MPAFRNADKIEVLESVLLFYRQRLELPEDAVFPTVNILAPGEALPGGEFFITITVGDGQFPLEEQDDEQLRENCQFTAMAFLRKTADWGGRDTQFLLDRRRGALALQNRLLLIVGEELKDPPGDFLIASRVYAVGTIAPTYDDVKLLGWTGVRFGVEFDWSIEGAEDLGDD